MCYRPAVFFRHLHLAALSLPQEKNCYALKKVTISFSNFVLTAQF
jgi:hypothetical protein